MQEATKTPIPIDFKYRLESKHFILEANYVEVELRVKLIYNESGTTYQRVFTNEDIGRGPIHPKEDLIDIFCTLIPSQYIKMLEQGMNILPIDFLDAKYHFGDFIERQGRGFTIFKEGVIKTKKKGPKKALSVLEPEWYESTLDLEQNKETDIGTLIEIKLGDFKREIHMEIEGLKKMIMSGDPSKFQSFGNLSDEGVAKISFPIQGVKSELELLQQQLRIQKQANPLQIDFRSPFASCFKYDKNVMTYNGPDQSTQTQILRIQSLSKTQVSSFRIRVQKLTNYMMIGVVDRVTQFDKRTSYNTTNAVSLYSPGSIYPGNKSVGCPYKTGDTIEIKVDPTKGIIQWIINYDTIVNHEVSSDFFTDKARQIVPYVELYTIGDSIKWVKSNQ